MEDNREEGHLVESFFGQPDFDITYQMIRSRQEIRSLMITFANFRNDSKYFSRISYYYAAKNILYIHMAFEIVERINVCKKCKLVAMSRTSCSVKLFNLNHLVHYTSQTKL